MRNPEQILENLNKQSVKHSKNDIYKFKELYKHFLNPLFYKHVYANKVGGTTGVDGENIVMFGEEAIHRIINCMKDESYQPKLIRGTNIHKKITGRYIQEIASLMLTIIYEPLFSEYSYGFRQGLSCHDALYAIQETFQGAVWFIEGGIKSFYDNIDHHIMIEILKQKIDDERFIRLVWKFLKAGYLEDWKFNKTYSKTPQGGIISPILANIYLNEFDKYIKQLKGDIEYKELTNEYKNLKLEQINSTGQSYNTKSRFRKISYVRYAGDFVIGIIGSREEAEKIKQDIGVFLKEQLKLELSQEKTLITHSSNKARFLSYEFNVCQKGIIHKVKNPNNGKFELKSKGRGQVRLTMPKDIIIKKLKELNVVEDFNAETWKARRKTKIIGCSDLEIVEFYNEQIRGLYNYFRLASNVSLEMNKFYHIMKWSMFHTYAAKYKSTIPKMLRKYSIGDTKEYGIPYDTEQGKQICKFYHEGFKRNQYADKSESSNEIDYIPNIYK